MSQTLSLRLIRNKDNNKTDDVITVSRTYCNATLKMKYKDSASKSSFTTTMSESGFLRYLDNLFLMMEFDKDPFQSVQVSFPLYPCILFTLDDIGRYTVQESVKEGARATFDAWKANTMQEMWDYEDA